MGDTGLVIILDLCFLLVEIIMQDQEWEGDGIGKAEEEEGENGWTRAPRGAMSFPQRGFCRLPDHTQGMAV